ncbi:MAG: DDE-type integrase/transposase/recombinase [Verrucomicrobiota bacterium]
MKRVSVYLKLRVIGAIDSMPGGTIVNRIKEVSKLTFHDEDGTPCVFTWRTIQTWLYLYKQGGVEMLKNRPRKDKGRHRKVSPEYVREAIEQALPEFRDRRYNKMMIYRRCIERGFLSQNECSQTSFFRLVRECDLLTPVSETNNKRRLAFSKGHANEMWQLDTMFGPFVKNGKTSTRTKLIAFIDDASRIIPHGQFFFSENTDNMILALRSALYKRGIPQTLYVDNGAIYTCAEINQICSRIGTLLCHTPVRDGAAKGKIERFFRTCRDQFLLRNLDCSNIGALNDAFRKWVEDEYNASVHSTLGMKPVDRFAMDLSRIRFLDPIEANEELFFFEQDRSVRKDNTFSVNGIRYEAPRDLSNRRIQVRFNRSAPERIVVYYKGQRMGQATELDFLVNDRAPGKSSDTSTDK